MVFVNVLAGDLSKGRHYVDPSSLESLAIATEETVKRFGGTVGWGLVGGLALGPVGLLAGLLIGGKQHNVTFVAKLKDGRKLFATTDAASFRKVQAGCFQQGTKPPAPDDRDLPPAPHCPHY